MSSAVLELAAGKGLWFDGSLWTVCEVHASTARLHDDRSHYRSVAICDLLEAATSVDDPSEPREEYLESTVVALSSLTSRQRAAVEREATVLGPLLQSNPPSDLLDSDRVKQAADTLGVSVRSVQRRLLRLEQLGPAGLIDARLLKPTRRSVDPRWDTACMSVLAEFTGQSTPSKQTVIRRATRAFLNEVPDGVAPSRPVAYRRLVELDHGRYTFGEAKQRRSVAHRPQGVLGQLRPTRPGEYVLMDGYKLDVFAMEPVTMRWVNTELTVAMDLFDRSIKGIRLRAVAAKSADVASVLHQMLTPQVWGTGHDCSTGPYSGVPEHVVLGSTGNLPDTVVIDHGKVYMSAHTLGACRRLGISVQPAIPGKPTDKPALERFFRSLRMSLLDKLPGYKGPNIHARGKDIEKGAFYYVTELEQLLREWVGDVYHRKAHRGLRDPRLPKVDLSPQEMFNRGIELSGLLRLPSPSDLRFELLDVAWRNIHHYGIDIDGRRYDGAALNSYRGHRSEHGGAHPGKWPFHVDIDDVRVVYFQDPIEHSWHDLQWRLAVGINAPFSKDAADFTRALSVSEQRHVDPQQAVDDLLVRWSKEEVIGRRERTLALRLTAQATTKGDEFTATERASLPGVIDLFSRHKDGDVTPDHCDDLDDVFERYYAAHPQEATLEVFEE